jgi:hypothetical protein
MATAGTDAARFDPEASRSAMDKMSINIPKPQVKMSINIPVSSDGEFSLNRQGQRCVEKARAVHIQVMRIREEDEHLREDLRERVNPRDRIEFLPIASQMKDAFFRYSRATFPSPLGRKAGVRSL